MVVATVAVSVTPANAMLMPSTVAAMAAAANPTGCEEESYAIVPAAIFGVSVANVQHGMRIVITHIPADCCEKVDFSISYTGTVTPAFITLVEVRAFYQVFCDGDPIATTRGDTDVQQFTRGQIASGSANITLTPGPLAQCNCCVIHYLEFRTFSGSWSAWQDFEDTAFGEDVSIELCCNEEDCD